MVDPGRMSELKWPKVNGQVSSPHSLSFTPFGACLPAADRRALPERCCCFVGKDCGEELGRDGVGRYGGGIDGLFPNL